MNCVLHYYLTLTLLNDNTSLNFALKLLIVTDEIQICINM